MAALAVLTLALQFPAALHADTTPWIKAEADVRATEADIAKGGILAIRSHVEGLENILDEGKKSFPPPPSTEGKMMILVDGQVEMLVALGSAAADKRDAVAIFNPYPSAAFYLALYYNEIQKPDDALRAVNAGMKLTTPEGLQFGAHMIPLFAEQAAAFEMLKRFQDAFDICDKGLKLASANKPDKARMYRCRSFALTELDRLDEAQQSLEESLKLEPGNPVATQELAYIVRLRAGGRRAPVGVVLTPRRPQTADQPDSSTKPN
jgi:tetratricopeptide (TPR) repeat protein